jgi:hypothetical protein
MGFSVFVEFLNLRVRRRRERARAERSADRPVHLRQRYARDDGTGTGS